MLSDFTTTDIVPAVSADGLHFAFTSYDQASSNMGILLMDADGENHRAVTWAPGFNVSPVFGPSSSTIVYRSHRDNKFDLYETDLQGSYHRKLTADVPGHVFLSEFSSDGRQLLMTTDIQGFDKVWRMNADGTDATQLTFGSGNDHGPRFVPDTPQTS
jgi:Tol biopolymer transport system component